MENKQHGNPIAFLKWVAEFQDENGHYIELTGDRWHFSDKDDTDNVSEEQLWGLYKIHYPEVDEAQQGGIVRETIENILFKSGKLYQEECTYLADIILQDCSTHYQELKEAKDAAVMFCNKHNVTATELAETVDRAQALADALQGLLEWHNTTLGYGLGRKIEAATEALNAWNGNGQKKEGEDE